MLMHITGYRGLYPVSNKRPNILARKDTTSLQQKSTEELYFHKVVVASSIAEGEANCSGRAMSCSGTQRGVVMPLGSVGPRKRGPNLT